MALASQSIKYNYVMIQPIGGRAVDLTGHLQHIEYFENIMSPTISMNMKISSSFNFVSELPIRGGEKISMEVETLSGTVKFGSVVKNENDRAEIVSGSGELYVYKLENLDQPSTAQTFTLKITSPEYFSNETSRCTKKYKPAPIDVHVKDILNNTTKINPDRIGQIDKTKNSYSFIGNTKKPFHTISWLCPKAIAGSKQGVSGEGEQAKAVGTAGYLFFENKDGFNFRSIEGLVSRTRENIDMGGADSADAKIKGDEIHGPYIHSGKGAVGNLYKAEENFKINHVHINRGTDIRKGLAVGQFANSTIFFDSLSHVVSEYDYKLFGKDGMENRLGLEDEAEIISNQKQDLKMLKSRLFVRVSDHGTLGIGTDGFQTSGIDQGYQAKSASRYNQLFSQSVDIQIPLNTSIKVGDIINCIFPELKGGTDETIGKDASASGNYLVTRLNHHIQPNASFSSLNLVRDSYGYAKINPSNNQSTQTKTYESNREKQRKYRFK
tara:strand:+ start:2983 stop:4467 length:1485 start_codon:yes stop_codon:yes gene_type:complete